MALNQIRENINTLIKNVENTADLMGENINFAIKNADEIIEYGFKVIKDVIDGEDTYTSVVKHGNTVIQTFTETTLTNALVKTTEFATGVSAAALCADVPMLAGLGSLYLTWAVPTLDKGFNISVFLKEEYRDFMTDVETGFVDEEIIRGFKAITDIENFTVENYIKTISHIADTFQNISLAELAFSWNKFWYRAAGFEWEAVYNDSGKAMLQYSRQVGSEIINTVAMRNADGYMTICQLDAGYTNIDIDDETGSFVVGYEDGSVKYITGIDTSSGDGAWVIDGNIGTDDNDSILGTLEDDFIYGNYNALLAS
jgi:hypothetical protein